MKRVVLVMFGFLAACAADPPPPAAPVVVAEPLPTPLVLVPTPSPELVTAEWNKQVAAWEADRAAGLKVLSRKDVDGVDQRVAYYHPKAPKYTNIKTTINCWILQEGALYIAALKINYYSNKWIFFDEVRFAWSAEHADVLLFRPRRDVVDGGVTEVTNLIVSDSTEGGLMIQRDTVAKLAAQTPPVIARLRGDKYYDHTLAPWEQESMKACLQVSAPAPTLDEARAALEAR